LLAEHAAAHRAKPGRAVVGLEVQVDSLEEYERVRRDPYTAGRHLHGRREKTMSWLFFLTGNASVARDTLLKAGMFDESFTGYGHEDLELGYRLSRLGVPIVYNPRAINYHWHPVGLDERFKRARLAGISTRRFYLKHKDPAVLLKMGVNPLTLALSALAERLPGAFAFLRRRAAASPAFRELALQYCYLAGYREAVRDWRETGGTGGGGGK